MAELFHELTGSLIEYFILKRGERNNIVKERRNNNRRRPMMSAFRTDNFKRYRRRKNHSARSVVEIPCIALLLTAQANSEQFVLSTTLCL